MIFDEYHFVENARNYLAGKADWNDHPPLGKLLMAAAMAWVGDDSVGWRIVPLAFGLASIALAYLVARTLFRDRLSGLVAAAFVALDGFLIVYSRMALLDGMLAALGLACLLVLAIDRGWLSALGWGVLLGLATSIKLSGITVALPIAFFLLSSRLRWRVRVAQLGAASVLALGTYYAQYALGHALTGAGKSPSDIAAATRALVVHHLGLTEMANPLTSHWYTWWLPKRPITLRHAVDSRHLRAMTTLGNPLLWWCSTATMLAGIGYLAQRSARFAVSPAAGRGLRDPSARSCVLLCAAWLGFLSPWILTSRDSYIYHYLPSYTLGLVAFAGVVARAHRHWPRHTLIFVTAVAVVSIFYAPVWGQFTLTQQGYAQRLFLGTWR